MAQDTTGSITTQPCTEPKYKVGDKLQCKPRFENGGTTFGGSGYNSGRTFTVERITNNNGDLTVYWPTENSSCGIYERAVELAVPKELPIFN